jgi:hypothetical protein
MALPPPIPQKPADRLETREEYERRRAAIAQYRSLADEVSRWSRSALLEFLASEKFADLIFIDGSPLPSRSALVGKFLASDKFADLIFIDGSPLPGVLRLAPIRTRRSSRARSSRAKN